MSLAASAQPPVLDDFDLRDAIKLTALAAELGVSMEALRRYRLAGLKTVKCGRQRLTTVQWFREFLAQQSGIAANPQPSPPPMSRARAADLARVDRELDAAGI